MLCYQLATGAHVAQLVELRIEFLAPIDGVHFDRGTLAEAIRKYFADNIPSGEHVAAVALDGEKIVAVAGLIYHRYPPSGNDHSGLRGYIVNVYTLPSHRGQGIATRLLEMLVEYARSHGCRRVTLHAMPEARSLYTRLGFRAIDSEMRLEFAG